MKLLFVNQFYRPDVAATSQVMTDLCEHLAGAGHEVHVLCSGGQYSDAAHGGQRPRFEILDGVHVHRAGRAGSTARGMLGRIIEYLWCHLAIGLRTVLAAQRCDVMVTLTTPPLIGLWATIGRALSFGRCRHVCWVMDLHPDCEFALGVFNRANPAARLLGLLNDLHVRRADACVVLGDYMAKRLRDKRVGPDRLQVIELWGHDHNEPGHDDPHAGLDLEGRFVVMYSGNAGLAHDFDAVCQAMLELRDDERFAFLFVGGGRRMEQIRAFRDEHRLAQVHMAGYVERRQLGASLARGDVHLITLRDEVAGMVVPCKLYGIMAAGRPVVFVGPGQSDTAQTIQTTDCGRCCPTNDPATLVATLKQLAADASECKRLAANARRAAETTYHAERQCGRWVQLLTAL